ncbi:hypothetical protein [Limimaricola cinnabarinus]|uniref:SAM-dependent methyltransferase n=1 Tax=Limimaricola cinnabarinus TaxID=1125964 RepID=A0A2G1MCT8_9RHOB|nr:hypothetical protein [Limimaricola cinnabarinus]PHP26528.1 hypothetical protein CJ301_15890 [Limimaricola cinnabarinus]
MTTPTTTRPFFDTTVSIAEGCLRQLEAICPLEAFDTIIDPAAGPGALSTSLRNRVALDIAPRPAGLCVADFATWTPDCNYDRVLVVGAAAFGRNGKSAVDFFNAAAGYADTIALLLPRSVRKASQQNRLDPMFHLIHDEDIVGLITGEVGKERNVPCVFQVWQRCVTPRPKIMQPKSHPDFVFSGRSDADLAVQRVGANAGRIKPVAEAGSASSHYYLKATDGCADELRACLATIDFDLLRYQVAGIPSVSKGDLVALYEAARVATGKAPAIAEEATASAMPTSTRPAMFDLPSPGMRLFMQFVDGEADWDFGTRAAGPLRRDEFLVRLPEMGTH